MLAAMKVGELLGPHPGKGVGGGRGKKLLHTRNSLSGIEVSRFRAVRWKAEHEYLNRYAGPNELRLCWI